MMSDIDDRRHAALAGEALRGAAGPVTQPSRLEFSAFRAKLAVSRS